MTEKNNIKEFFVLAVENHKKNNFVVAENYYKKILNLDKNHLDSIFLLGTLSIQIKNFDRAKELLSKVIQNKPKHSQAHNNLGIAFKELGEIQKAIICYKKAIEIQVNFEDALNNLGNALLEIKEYEKSILCYEKVLLIKPNHINANYNKANILQEIKEYQKSILCYEKVLKINPNHIQSLNNLGGVLKEIKEYHKSILCYEKALQINNQLVETYNNLGIVYRELGEIEKAINYYKKAIEIKPNFIPAHSNLMETYERTNNDEKLENAILSAKNLIGDAPVIKLYQGALLYKNEKFYEAVESLEKISFKEKQINFERLRVITLAKCYDRLEDKNTDKAFGYFVNANNLALKTKNIKFIDKERYIEKINIREKFFKDNEIKKWPVLKSIEENQEPVFLIGFPRSGTTLLDTILSCHPLIEVIEEKETVAKLIKSLDELNKGDFNNLKNIDDSQLKLIRKIYFDSLKNEVKKQTNSKVYIDKLPLNTIHVGEIVRIFPNAKFIFSIRHPYDCVLSCFMQNFRLNDAMSNFLTLEDSAFLYDSVMRLWTQYRSIFSINYHEVKYEDLIENLEFVTKSIIHFLGLPWDNSLLNYYKAEKKKELISTTSYNQVIKPIFFHARGRWKRYEKQFTNIYPTLEPWVRKFKYK